MNTHFKYEYINTTRFEDCYEEELRISPEERKDIIKSGLVVYLQGSSGLIGECYGATPFQLEFIEECPEDCSPADDESVYVYSTTILPDYRNQGYGEQLIEEFARHASDQGFVKLVGHATTPTMVNLRKKQGAIFRPGGVHKNWFDTDRTARFYTQFLTQNKEYNCGPMALAYILERMGRSYLVYDLEEALDTDEEYGTSPESIEDLLRGRKIPYEKTGTCLRPNSIIDITVGDDGHWIVLVEQDESTGNWWGYDPDPVGPVLKNGLVLFQERYLLANWHSSRYGKRQGFTLL